ncbi:MAG: hypothetical protein Q7S89_01185 [bacterium]|nr:hypothetical protein [bacterium]
MSVPLTSFAAGEETITREENFSSLDPKYTTTAFHRLPNRITLGERLSARAVGTATYMDALCDARTSARDNNLDLLLPTCAKGTDGTIIAGLQLDPARRTYSGTITHVARNGAVTNLPTNGNLDGDKDTLIVGADSQSHFFILRRTDHVWRAWEVTNGVWRAIDSSDITNIAFSQAAHIAWSGKRWYILNGRDLWMVHQKILVPVAAIPNVPTTFSGLATSINETGMVIRTGSTNPTHFLITDDGFSQSQNAEPNDIRTNDPVVWTMLKSIDADVPANTTLVFAVSNDGGKNWQSIDVGREVLFHINEKAEARKFRWRATLATNDANQTPVIRKMIWQYTTQNPYPGAVVSRDAKRVADLQKTKRIIDSVRKEINEVPFVEWHLNPEQQWQRLADILTTVSMTRHLSLRIDLPNQSGDRNDAFRYHYTGSNNNYVLWTSLENPEHRVLTTDLDGVVLSVNCNDPVLCLSSDSPTVEQPAEVSNPPKRLRDIPRLVRVRDDEKIWLITENGMRRHVLNLTVLRALARRHGFRINQVTRATLESYPENVLLRPEGTDRVYYIWNKNRRWVTSPAVFERYDFHWEDVTIVPIEEINQYQELPPVTQ